MQKVFVRVPASASNLGPGFDCLGVALQIYNEIVLERRASKTIPDMARNAAELFFNFSGRPPFAFACSSKGKIPIARGLGSSASLRIGVLFGLNQLADAPLNRREIFSLASRLEGHPDNAAPVTFGGFTVARGTQVQRSNVSQKLFFVVLIPDFEIETEAARALLPARISREDAAKSSGNACAITAAFASRRYENLRGAFVDHLHQPFRKKLVPFLDDVIAAGEKAGALGGFLSGSGSAIICVTQSEPGKIATAMRRAAPAKTRVVTTTADNHGARCIIKTHA